MADSIDAGNGRRLPLTAAVVVAILAALGLWFAAPGWFGRP